MKLAEQHFPLAIKIACRMKRDYPSHVTADDLIGPATLGLVQAALRFDPSLGLTFGAFASFRIRGAILDYLRSIDHLTRHQRKRAKHSGQQLRLPMPSSTPSTQFEEALASQAWLAVQRLSEREQTIIRFYYQEHLTMREIGSRLGINESRVSQLHSRAIGRLRQRLGNAGGLS